MRLANDATEASEALEYAGRLVARVCLNFLAMFDRIVSNPAILSGKPCIKGTRISVEFILELMASGGTATEIISKYPQLSPNDVEQAVRYAAESLKNDVIITERLAS